MVACWQWAMNHTTQNWVEPFQFKPERFLEGGKDVHDKVEALQSFSLGPRNCIGKKYVISPPVLCSVGKLCTLTK